MSDHKTRHEHLLEIASDGNITYSSRLSVQACKRFQRALGSFGVQFAFGDHFAVPGSFAGPGDICSLGIICGQGTIVGLWPDSRRSRKVFAPRKPYQNFKPYDYIAVQFHYIFNMNRDSLHTKF